MFPVLPVKQRRDRLLALANEELAPRESESSQSVAQQEVEAAAASAKNSVGTKGAPLIRMYNLLRKYARSEKRLLLWVFDHSS